MIAHVWPGKAADVLVSDWRQIELKDGLIDIALCDGGLHLLDFPAGQARLGHILARLIAPGGRLVLRLFVPPARREDPQEVLDALLAGDIPNLNCLKLRLGMSLQESPSSGVPLAQVWLSLRSTGADWPELASRLNWSLEHLSAIDAYRDSQACYHFVTVDEAKNLFCAGRAFELHCLNVPSYTMGTQCPTVVFRRTERLVPEKAN
jgi:hypothetical protein